jgi:hypothetical protein
VRDQLPRAGVENAGGAGVECGVDGEKQHVSRWFRRSRWECPLSYV